MSKNFPIIVSPHQFDQVLRDAADSIGAFSMMNPEWAALAGQGVPIPPHEALGASAAGPSHRHDVVEVGITPADLMVRTKDAN